MLCRRIMVEGPFSLGGRLSNLPQRTFLEVVPLCSEGWEGMSWQVLVREEG